MTSAIKRFRLKSPISTKSFTPLLRTKVLMLLDISLRFKFPRVPTFNSVASGNNNFGIIV